MQPKLHGQIMSKQALIRATWAVSAPPGRMSGCPGIGGQGLTSWQWALVPSSPLMPLLAFRGWHRYRARTEASVWRSHAWRDSLPGEILFGQAAPAAVTREARESLAGEPTESADERLCHPNVQAASP